MSAAEAEAPNTEANSGRLAVAREALRQVERELAAKHELAAALERRWGEFSGAALREYAQGLATAYKATLATLRNQMAQLEGLALATGAGRDERVMAECPGFRLCGHKHPQIPVSPRKDDIVSAVRQWVDLARAWGQDPRAEADKILKFEPAQEPGPDDIIYAEKTELERKIVDLEFKMKGKV